MQVALGIIVVVLAVYYFASRGEANSDEQSIDEETELLQLCLGDREQAERLLALEIRKAPGLKRREAAKRAIRSLRRDVK